MVNAGPTNNWLVKAASPYHVNTGLATVVLLAVNIVVPAVHKDVLPVMLISDAKAFGFTVMVTGVLTALEQPEADDAST